MEEFKIILASYLAEYHLTSSELEEITSKLKPVKLKKNQTFCKKGAVAQRLGILISGLLYAYYESPKDNKTVSRFYFHPNNVIVCSFTSFSRRLPSQETIRTLEPSLLLTISKSNLDQLYSDMPKLNLLGRRLAEESYISSLQRIHDLQALSNNERISKLYKEYPEIFNRVGRQLLTSYLGMNRNQIARFLKEKMRVRA